jgi:hypothetical protein
MTFRTELLVFVAILSKRAAPNKGTRLALRSLVEAAGFY